jgi:hypothetical protein
MPSTHLADLRKSAKKTRERAAQQLGRIADFQHLGAGRAKIGKTYLTNQEGAAV